MKAPKITLVEITDPGCPRLWEVLIDGERVPGSKYGTVSAARVLKMGRQYLPVNDARYTYPFPWETKMDAAKAAVGML